MREWEMQPGETPTAYRAFGAFRDLGPERNLKLAASAHYGVEEASASQYQQIRSWSSRFDWFDRARAYDDHVEMAVQTRLEDLRRKGAEDAAERRLRIEEKLLEARERAADQALAMLAYPIARLTNTTTSEDGAVVHNTFEPARWSKSTISSLVAVAAGRHMPQGEPGDEPEDSGGFDPAALDRMSEEELGLLIRLMEKASGELPDPDDG
jgi:hypothetical protein